MFEIFDILLVTILLLSIASFSFLIVLALDMDSYEKQVCVSTAIVLFIIIILSGFSFKAHYNDIEEYYKLGQQDAVNGNVYYDINPNKVLIEKKK